MRHYLALMIAVYVFFGLGYAFLVQIGQGPDEIAHFIYIRSLACDFSLPPIADYETHDIAFRETHEGHQPPLYYALMALIYAPFCFYGIADFVWYIMRIVGVIIGVFWIVASYRLARLILPKDKYALCATAAIALIPSSSYIAAVINNDVLISLFFTVALIPLVKLIKYGFFTKRDTAVFIVAASLAMMTKAQGLILIPLLIVAFFLSKNKYALKNVAIACFSSLVLGGWYYGYCKLVHGSFMLQSLRNPVVESLFSMIFLFEPMTNITAVGSLTVATWGHFILPVWIVLPFIGNTIYYYLPLAIFTVVLIAGFFLELMKTAISRRLISFMLFTVLALYLSYVRYVFVVDYMAANQGRLILPLASFISCCGAMCVCGLTKKHRAIFALCIIAALLCINIFTLICAYRFYF